MKLISNHIKADNINFEKYKKPKICKMCGDKVIKGLSEKKAILSTFTDFEYLKYNSNIICEDCCKTFLGVFPSEKNPNRFNSLRNYNYIATNKKLEFLKRNECINFILNPPEPPFLFVITYGCKKSKFNPSSQCKIHFDTH